ncbi:MAG: hypothetical protein O3B73_05400 [bacterium]|nr:hypothetical protein [bacterium]
MALATPVLPGDDPALSVGAVRFRSVSVGICVIVASVWWDDWMTFYMDGSNISRSHFPLALLFPFVILAICNIWVGNKAADWALTRQEMKVVLAMGFVAIAVPYDGITGHLLGILGGVYYFASSENAWDFYLHDTIPTWLAPHNDNGEMVWFFEGTPPGQFPAIGVWVVPLFWWTILLAAVAFAAFCLVVVLRKQWVDHERLTYPLVEVGQLMTETEPDGQLVRVFRSPLFWIAFALVMFLKLWNVGSYFTPAFPPIPVEGGQFRFYPDFPFLIRRISFYAIGFGYFARLDVLFSVWFFVFLSAFEVFVFNKLGYTPGAADRQWQSEALGWQSGGALIFLAGWSLWMARSHLRDVWETALKPQSGLDDRQELLSYRTAVFGFLVSVLLIVAWLHSAGMDLLVIFTFLSIALLTFLGISRVVAELGLVYVYYEVQPYEAALNIWGTPGLDRANVTLLTFMRVFNSIGKGYLMPPFTQSVKTVDRMAKPRQIAWVLGGALMLAFVLSVADTLYLGYTYGAYNLGNMGLQKTAPAAFNSAVSAIRNPIPMGGKGGVAQWALVGMAVMAILTMVRYWVPSWPIHPIGLAIQGNYGVTKTVFSILIVWGVKSILMRIGGAKLYEKCKPFFIGLLVAQAVSTALVFGVDWIWFPMQGHNVHNF